MRLFNGLSVWLLMAAPAPLLAGPAAPAGGLLLCDGMGECAEDAAWVERTGVLAGRPMETMDVLLELDAWGDGQGTDHREALTGALAEARRAAAKGRWKAVEENTERARELTDQWRGLVGRQDLFHLYFLEGAAALKRGAHGQAQVAFRQAAAVLDIGQDPLPLEDEEVSRVWIDERRKLALAGRGTLVLDGVPDGAAVFVDGERLDTPETLLPPGEHRITVSAPGAVRSYKARVPVLADRTTRLEVELAPEDSAAWVSAGLRRAFQALELPEELEDRLAAYCARRGLDELWLVAVEDRRHVASAPHVSLGPPETHRPIAAEGDLLDTGDGIPSTFEGHLAVEHSAAGDRRPPPRERKARVMVFHPATGRLTADGGTAARWDGVQSTFRVGLALGYRRAMGRHHGTLDLVGEVPVGPVALEGRLGVARGEDAYRLYPDWTDRQLYHIQAGARWRGLEPLILGGAVDVLAPVAVGGTAMVGLETALGSGWEGGLEASMSILDQGPGWGLCLLLSRGE